MNPEDIEAERELEIACSRLRDLLARGYDEQDPAYQHWRTRYQAANERLASLDAARRSRRSLFPTE